jgi:hypothetical protein
LDEELVQPTEGVAKEVGVAMQEMKDEVADGTQQESAQTGKGLIVLCAVYNVSILCR